MQSVKPALACPAVLSFVCYVRAVAQGVVEAGSEEVAMGLYNLEHLQLLTDPLTSTKCLVAWGPNTCVVAFRGTAKQNAAYDMKVKQQLSLHMQPVQWLNITLLLM